jgi:hypothetical protein
MTALNDTKWIKLQEHIAGQEAAAFSIIVNDEQVSIAYEWEKEAEDSPMYGAASYSIGDSVNEALSQIYKDLRI